MTLLIALIANGIYEAQTGAQFIGTGWIVLLWVINVVGKSMNHSDIRDAIENSGARK